MKWQEKCIVSNTFTELILTEECYGSKINELR